MVYCFPKGFTYATCAFEKKRKIYFPFHGSNEVATGLEKNKKASRLEMKKTRKKFKFIVEKTRTGFSAYCTDHPLYTTGKSMHLLKANILEVVNFYLEDEQSMAMQDNVLLEMDLKQFFEYYRVINAKFLAERIGMNETLLSQYVKGRKKPSKNQVEKIISGINEIGIELSELRMVVREPER